MNFTYLARDCNGRVSRGILFAKSPVDLRASLHRMGLHLVSLEALPELNAQALNRIDPRRWLPVRSRDVELALRQLAIMLRSGLNLHDALKSLHAQTELVALSKILHLIHERVARGETLSAAMSNQRVFPAIVVQLVHVGEQTGTLDRVLEEAAKHLGQRRSAMNELRVAIAYPAIVATAAVFIAAYLIFAVIPELQKFLNAMGRKLPRMTQSLVDLAQWFQINGAFLSVGLLVLIVGTVILLRWPPGRLWIDRNLLRVPIIGNILRLAGTATLANSLTVMLHSGIRIVDALSVAKQLQGNRFLAALIEQASHSVVRGKSLAAPLSDRTGFSPMLASMIGVAEKTGQLEATLDEVASYCDIELKSKVKRMSQLVEPAVIVIAGVIVGYVYIAFFIALMSAGGNFK